MLTKSSLNRLMFSVQRTEVEFSMMLTLTYGKYFPTEGGEVKRMLNALLNRVRRLSYIDEYFWFLEFQTRGAPHIHLLLDTEGVTPRMRIDWALYWTNAQVQSLWFYGECPIDEMSQEVAKLIRFNMHESVFECIRDNQGARNYAMKYAAKQRQKKVPENYKDVGRFWGNSKGVVPEGVETDITEDELEEWLTIADHHTSRMDLIPRYLWDLKDRRSTAKALDGPT